MNVIEPVTRHNDEKIIGYIAECPGCMEKHVIYTDYAGHPNWSYNGDKVKPTFKPSLLVTTPNTKRRCHSFIENGQWRFLGDCTHKLKGKTVPMVPVDD